MEESLSAMRKGAGFETQEAVGNLLGVDAVTVSRWESGSRAPKLSIVKKLAKLYGVTSDDIINACEAAKEQRQPRAG